MPTESVNLQSQIVVAYNGTDDLATNGPVVSGDYDYMLISGGSASAMRFPLPEDFNDSATITNAKLTINIRRYDSSESPVDPEIPNTDQRHELGILAASSQVLPTTVGGVQSAAMGTDVKTIGYGTYSPALDYSTNTSFTSLDVDLTDAMEEARIAGRLAGTHVVVLFQPVNYYGSAYLAIKGITESPIPTFELTWISGSPVYFLFDDIVITSDGMYLDCSVDTGALIANATDNLSNFLTLETSSVNPVTVTYHSGNASGTLRFLLSRMVEQNETLTLTHLPGFSGASINRGAESLENFEDAAIVNDSVMRGPVLAKDSETLSESYLTDFRIADITNSETLSEGDAASFIVDAMISNSETFSESADVDARIVFSALTSDSETLSESADPAIEVISILRPSLFPSQLFGNYPCRIF